MLCMLSSYLSYFLIFLSKPATAEKLETMRVQKTERWKKHFLSMEFGNIIILALFVLSEKKKFYLGRRERRK